MHCRHLQYDIDQYMKRIADKMVDKQALKQKMIDIMDSVAENNKSRLKIFSTILVSLPLHLSVTCDSQLTEFGYLEACGGNKNRTYKKKI